MVICIGLTDLTLKNGISKKKKREKKDKKKQKKESRSMHTLMQILIEYLRSIRNSIHYFMSFISSEAGQQNNIIKKL